MNYIYGYSYEQLDSWDMPVYDNVKTIYEEHIVSADNTRSSEISRWLSSFREAGYDPEIAKELARSGSSHYNDAFISRDLRLIEQHDVRVVFDNSEHYPKAFTDHLCAKRPGALFCKGAVSSLNERLVFICGARDASKEGCEIAYKCGRLLAESGCVVVSGYARGVDMAAHLGALEAGGSTIAVLPYGFSRFSVRKAIQDVFDESRFLAVSEMPPSCGFMRTAALRRNKLMVALSGAVIVVEPGESGGTWYSASKAKSLKKPLFFHEGIRREIVGRLENIGGERIAVKNGAPMLETVYKSAQLRNKE